MNSTRTLLNRSGRRSLVGIGRVLPGPDGLMPIGAANIGVRGSGETKSGACWEETVGSPIHALLVAQISRGAIDFTAITLRISPDSTLSMRKSGVPPLVTFQP